MNPMQIIQMMRSGNPQQVAANILRQSNNPMVVNAVQMYERGDAKGLKNMAENLCREKGITIEEAKQTVMNMLGAK